MEKDNPSGFGLTLEVGFAAALGKQIILIDDKSSSDDTFKQKFNIVRESSTIVFEKFSDGVNFLKKIKNGNSAI